MNLYTDLFTKSISKRIYEWSKTDNAQTIEAIRKEEEYIKTQMLSKIFSKFADILQLILLFILAILLILLEFVKYLFLIIEKVFYYTYKILNIIRFYFSLQRSKTKPRKTVQKSRRRR